MYAVVKTGGKQIRVEPGARVRVEQLPGYVGSSIELDQVLLVGGGESVKIGTPMVEGARVSGTITAQGRHPKIRVFKMKRRKGYRRLQVIASRTQKFRSIRSTTNDGPLAYAPPPPETGNSRWRIKKDRAALATVATATANGVA